VVRNGLQKGDRNQYKMVKVITIAITAMFLTVMTAFIAPMP